jgi:hypothetical protein
VFAEARVHDQPTVTACLVPACDRFLRAVWFSSGVCSTELHGNPSGTLSRLSHPFQPFPLALTLKSTYSSRILSSQLSTTQYSPHYQVLTRLCRLCSCVAKCAASLKPGFWFFGSDFKPKSVLDSRIGVSQLMCTVMVIIVASLPNAALASQSV